MDLDGVRRVRRGRWSQGREEEDGKEDGRETEPGGKRDLSSVDG
jgi:hypothetical protein